jgi:hypothetical protein
LIQALLSRDVDIRKRNQGPALWAGSVRTLYCYLNKQSTKTI